MEVKKKPIYKRIWFWIVIVVLFIGVGTMSDDETETSKTNTTKVSSEKKADENEDTEDVEDETEKNKEQVLYDKNDILIKVTGYEYHSVMDYLELKVYIENNSKQDLVFNVDGDVTLDGYTLGTYFYEEINKGTKKNATIDIRELSENGIEEELLKKLTFKMDIYHSDNYIVDDRIEEDFKMVYKF